MSDGVAGLRDALRERYTIERELGRGGIATVYVARDLKHKRDVALKVLDPELARCSYDTARQESADDLVDLEPPGSSRPVLLKLREAGHQPMDCGFQVRGPLPHVGSSRLGRARDAAERDSDQGR